MDKVKAIEVLKPLVESYVDHANITMKEEDDDIAEALEMAVEALKVLDVPNTNVGDMISRQGAIDALMTWEEESAVWDEECIKHRGEPFWEAPSDIIKQLPSVQSELKWIPCSERLPEKAGEYLITKIRIGWNGQKYTELAVDYFYGDYGKEYGMVWKISKKVVAWLPLPKQYKWSENE